MNKKLHFFRKFLFLVLLLLPSVQMYGEHQAWKWNDLSTLKGKGTSSDPYLISSIEDFATLAHAVNEEKKTFKGQHFKQTKDITLNEDVINSDGSLNEAKVNDLTFAYPVGSKYALTKDHFMGFYDGNGHSISGLYYTTSIRNVQWMGVFGGARDAFITNLTIKDSYFELATSSKIENSYGALVGNAINTMIMNCHVENCIMDVKAGAKTSVGGLVGFGEKSVKVILSSFSGNMNIVSEKAGNYAGIMGLCSVIRKSRVVAGSIKSCVASGKIKVTFPQTYANDGTCVSGIVNSDISPTATCLYPNVMVLSSTNRLEMDVETTKGEHVPSNLKVSSFANSSDVINTCVDLSKIYVGKNGDVDLPGCKVAPTGIAHYMMIACALYGSVTVRSSRPYSINVYAVSWIPDMHMLDRYYCIRLNRYFIHNTGNNYYSEEYADCKEGVPDGVIPFSTVEDLIKHENCKWIGHPASFLGTMKATQGDMASYNGWPWPIECGGSINKFEGAGTKDDPFKISSEKELRYLQTLVEDKSYPTSGQYFMLTNDIDLSHSDRMKPIGDNNTFMGTFDGNGHAIIGAKTAGPGPGALFGKVGGTIKNLAVLNPRKYNFSPLVNSLFSERVSDDGAYHGTISNCYVEAPLQSGVCGGLCNYADTCCIIENSYFKGTIPKDAEAAAFCYQGYGYIVKNCYASVSVVGDGDGSPTLFDHSGRGRAEGSYVYADCSEGTLGFNGSLSVKDEQSLNSLLKEPFVPGIYRPVLPSAKHYQVVYPSLNDKGEVEAKLGYLDAIPETGGANNIARYIPAKDEDYKSDQLLWSLPNVAVYDSVFKADYLLQCNINPAKPFIYKACDKDLKETETTLKGALHFPLDLDSKNHTYLLCLPGTVEKGSLPEGSKLMICGKVTEANGEYQANIVECDSVPAGLPFLAYIPGKDGDVVDIPMRGVIATQPIQSTTSGKIQVETALKGNFLQSEMKVPAGSYSVVDSIADGYELTANDAEKALPLYRAYFEGMSGQDASSKKLHLIDYILLNEVANNIGDVIANNENKTVNLKLKRALKAGTWNTICLPFSLSEDEVKSVFGEGTKIEKLSDVSYSDGVCRLVFGSETEIKAGEAYLLKPSKVSDDGVYSLGKKLLGSVEPKKEDKQVTMDGEQFNMGLYGTYERQLLAGDSDGFGTVLGNVFFIQGNNLYQVDADQNIILDGFRCYIQTSSAAATQALSGARLVHADGSTTALRLVEMGKGADGSRIYDLQGIETAKPVKAGVYVKNGKKFVVK